MLNEDGEPIKDLELPEVLDGSISHELDIRETIKYNNSLFYFYPTEVDVDRYQLQKLGQNDTNVIKIKSRTHGVPFPNAALGTILEMPKESLYPYGGGNLEQMDILNCHNRSISNYFGYIGVLL